MEKTDTFKQYGYISKFINHQPTLINEKFPVDTNEQCKIGQFS